MEQVSQVGCISKFPFARKKPSTNCSRKNSTIFQIMGLLLQFFLNFNEFTKCVVVDNVCSCEFLFVCWEGGNKKEKKFLKKIRKKTYKLRISTIFKNCVKFQPRNINHLAIYVSKFFDQDLVEMVSVILVMIQ